MRRRRLLPALLLLAAHAPVCRALPPRPGCTPETTARLASGNVIAEPISRALLSVMGLKLPPADSLIAMARGGLSDSGSPVYLKGLDPASEIQELASAGKILLVKATGETTALGRLATWDLAGNLRISEEAAGLHSASGSRLLQLAILRAVTANRICRLASKERPFGPGQRLEVEYLADLLARTLAPRMGAVFPGEPPLPLVEGTAYYPGAGHDTERLRLVARLFPAVKKALYEDPEYGARARTLHTAAAPGIEVTLVGKDVTEPEAAASGGEKFGVGIFACPGGFGRLMRHRDFVAGTIVGVKVGGAVVNSAHWGYHPILEALDYQAIGLERRSVIASGGHPVEIFVKTREVSKEELKKLFDLDWTLGDLGKLFASHGERPSLGPTDRSPSLQGDLANHTYRDDLIPVLERIERESKARGEAFHELVMDRLLAAAGRGAGGAEKPTLTAARDWIRARAGAAKRRAVPLPQGAPPVTAKMSGPSTPGYPEFVELTNRILEGKSAMPAYEWRALYYAVEKPEGKRNEAHDFWTKMLAHFEGKEVSDILNQSLLWPDGNLKPDFFWGTLNESGEPIEVRLHSLSKEKVKAGVLAWYEEAFRYLEAHPEAVADVEKIEAIQRVFRLAMDRGGIKREAIVARLGKIRP